MNKTLIALTVVITTSIFNTAIASSINLPTPVDVEVKQYSACSTARSLTVDPYSKKLMTCLNGTWEVTPLKVIHTIKDTPSSYHVVYQRHDGTCVKELAEQHGNLTSFQEGKLLTVKNWQTSHHSVKCTVSKLRHRK